MEPGGSALEVAQPEEPADQLSALLPSRRAATAGPDGEGQPGYFRDRNLDDFVAPVPAGREEYGLTERFCTPLPERVTVSHRQVVFLDLEAFSFAAAFSQLTGRAINPVANAPSSKDTFAISSSSWRRELNSYVSCANLHDQLAATDEPVCRP